MRVCVLISFLTAAAFAQSSLNEPYFLIRIIRTGPEPGAASVAPYERTKAAVDVIGMRSITGPAQNWLIESHRSFGTLEGIENALAEDPLPRGDSSDPDLYSTRWIAMFRHNLSYRPDDAIKLIPMARYYQISVVHIRPGADLDFAELVRLRRALFDSINLERPELGYQVISGTSSGTYVFIAPLQSLKVLDNGLVRVPAFAEGHGSGKARQINADADVTREHFLFRVEPSRSFVSDTFAGSDPGFWHGK